MINSTTKKKREEIFREFGGVENPAMVAGDVSKKETGELLVATALERSGSVDVVISNAGIFVNKPFLEVTEEYLDIFLIYKFKRNIFYQSNSDPSNAEKAGWNCGKFPLFEPIISCLLTHFWINAQSISGSKAMKNFGSKPPKFPCSDSNHIFG